MVRNRPELPSVAAVRRVQRALVRGDPVVAPDLPAARWFVARVRSRQSLWLVRHRMWLYVIMVGCSLLLVVLGLALRSWYSGRLGALFLAFAPYLYTRDNRMRWAVLAWVDPDGDASDDRPSSDQRSG